jgi:hypothetical protein
MKRAPREKSEQIPEPRKPVEVLHWPGEPERKCGNCQHWRPLAADPGKGDCHNLISQFMVTRSTSCCARGFYPAVDRFPLAERMHA